MTGWGGKIPDVSVDALRTKLAETDDDGTAVKRLMTAIAYKRGQSPADIEETFGISRKTVYLWLDRFEERGLDDGLYDEPKPGRPPKLTHEQLQDLAAVLQEPPADAGYERIQVWTPALTRHWLQTRFDVEYTLRHVRRLMDDVGPSSTTG